MNNPKEESDLQIRQDMELGRDLEYLQTLPQFQRVVIDGYIKNVLSNTSKDMISLNPAVRQNVMEEIMSVGYFRQYLDNIVSSATIATEDLGDN